MKRMILSLVALVMMLGSVSAQRLVSVKNYGANWQKTMISLKNKPNGTIYRLRKENQNEYLPRVPEAKGLEQFISERIDIGWLAMYHLPMSDDDYKFIVVIYDKDEHPVVFFVQSRLVPPVLEQHVGVKDPVFDRRRALPAVGQPLLIFFLCIDLDIEVRVVDDL